jgi:oligosaccharide repeat unit polymerase
MFNNRREEGTYGANTRTTAMCVQPSRCRSSANIILAIHGCVLSLLVLLGLVCYYGELSADSLYHPACLLIPVLIGWWYSSWIAFSKATWFHPYFLFLTAIVLFNCGQFVLEAFGLSEDSLLAGHSEEVSLATLYLVALGISALHFGVLLGTALCSRRHPRKGRWERFPEIHSRNLYRVGVALLVISAVPSMLRLQDQLQAVMQEGYGSLYQQQAAIGLSASINILSYFLIPGFAMVIAGARRRPLVATFSLLAVFAWSALGLFLGGRAYALMPAVGILWLWDRAVRRVARTALIGSALLLMFVVFPVVASTRNEAGSDRLSPEHMLLAFTTIDNPIVAELSEMGSSANTIAWTMELVPSVRPFALGSTYLSAALTLIPNLSPSQLHPAMRLFGYDIPDYWLAWEVDPELASRGGSYGYSFLAEAYLNFGWAAPILLFFFGALYGPLIGWTLTGNDPAKMAIMAIFLSSVLFFARSALMNVVRPLCWCALIPYFVVLLLDAWCYSRQVTSERITKTIPETGVTEQSR